VAYRVAQWATGWVGRLALAAIAAREDLELVGVLVHSPEKAGRDAGELAGREELGVKATRDAGALLALRPDCVCYAAHGETRVNHTVDDLCRILASGANVVTTSLPGLVFPAGFDPAARARLEAACRAGGTSLFCSGIEPGFAGDLLPLTFLTMVRELRMLRASEIFCYADYPVASTMLEVFGFGKPLDHRPLLALPGVMSGTWGPPVRMVAHALGLKLDAIRETFEAAPTPRRLKVAAGTLEAGTIGAVRFATIGVVGGRDVIAIEHVNRMALDLAPHWPTAAHDGTYRLEIDGEPSIACDFRVGWRPGDDHSEHGMLATAMRVVNAIPAVCDAPPGLVSALDLGLTLPRGAVR
jgi:hypothetical protein